MTVVNSLGAESTRIVPPWAFTIHGDAEAKTTAFHRTVMRRITAIETIEDALEFFRRDAGAGVSDGQFSRTVVAAEGDGDAAIGLVGT